MMFPKTKSVSYEMIISRCIKRFLMVIVLKTRQNIDILHDKWIDSEYNEELAKRKKGQHLTVLHKDHLLRLLSKYPESHRSIIEEFNISRSTYQRLKLNQRNHTSDMNTSSTIDEGNFSDWNHAKRIIKSIVFPPTILLTIGMIKQEIKEKTSIEYSSRVLSNFIKHELCYSYKRGWSRT